MIASVVLFGALWTETAAYVCMCADVEYWKLAWRRVSKRDEWPSVRWEEDRHGGMRD